MYWHDGICRTDGLETPLSFTQSKNLLTIKLITKHSRAYIQSYPGLDFVCGSFLPLFLSHRGLGVRATGCWRNSMC
uniref:Uncharacterized protein n=1 Tax=Picea glauca TaxID=3330 RepID=A0A101M4S4_PICGL|nr:hypothetical protein ABT39_MTgene841 [Picea glauca]QHR88308.1 hypothetical protein Q903MT_gene2321 [Picea sitchensis]